MPNFPRLKEFKKIAVDFKVCFRYNLIVKIYNFGGIFTMKKILAVFLAVLMAFSALTLVALAEDAEEPATTVTEEESSEPTTVPRYPEQESVSNIVNPDGLVFPTNDTQLEMSFIFKIIEKIINFFTGLFGSDVDANLTDSVADFGKWLEEALSNISGSLD